MFALKLAVALAAPIAALSRGPDRKSLLHRLCAALGPVTRMELAGISVDRDALSKQAEAWDKELAELKAEIADLGIKNPASAPQVATWLGRELVRLDATSCTNLASNWPRTCGGNFSTQAKHLRRLANHLPGAVLLARFSHLEQLRSNFGNKLIDRINPQTGRLHGNFKLASAKSGRFASSKPNMQNIPKLNSVRAVFVAAPGKQLVVADYSQLELRVMAHIAKDHVMTEAYRSGLDLHSVTAAGMLGLTPEEFDTEHPAHKEARQKAKAVNFGVIYGSGPSGLREFARDAYNLQLTKHEARTVIDRFLATYRGVARWQREQEAKTRRMGTVSTLGGRVYRFAWEPGGEYSRNSRSQSTYSGDRGRNFRRGVGSDRCAVTRRAARQSATPPASARRVRSRVEADGALLSTAKRILEQEMIAAFLTLLPGAPTKGLVDACSGSTWAAAKANANHSTSAAAV